MRRGLPFVISAPSGAGKTTLVRELRRRHPELGFSVSHTTRSPRAGERDGVDYHFVDRERFAKMVENDEFAEWAEVHGNRYGTSFAALEEALAGGRDLLLDIDVQGALQIDARVPGAVLVFIRPPSMDELRRRLVARASDAASVVEQRLSNALGEMEQAPRYHHQVVNDVVARAAEQLAAIVAAEQQRAENQDRNLAGGTTTPA